MIGLNNICDNSGANIKFKRVGRGVGSGKGKTSGRGMKGQKSRSGVSIHNFAGGQMPLYRRFAHIGFNNKKFKKMYYIVNLSSIQKAIDDKLIENEINIDTLIKAGVIKTRSGFDGLNVLGFGKISSSVTIEANKISHSAKNAIEAVGGKIVIKNVILNTDDRGRFAKSGKVVA